MGIETFDSSTAASAWYGASAAERDKLWALLAWANGHTGKLAATSPDDERGGPQIAEQATASQLTITQTMATVGGVPTNGFTLATAAGDPPLTLDVDHELRRWHVWRRSDGVGVTFDTLRARVTLAVVAAQADADAALAAAGVSG